MRDSKLIKKDNRLPYIDLLKGIGIILVVAGHSNIPEIVKAAIYSFHMPLFFFISGYLFKDKEQSVKTYVKHKACTLLHPYYVFGIIIILYNTLFDTVFHSFSVWKLLKRVIALLYGNMIWENNADYIGTLWFLVALFVVETLFFLMYRLINGKKAKDSEKLMLLVSVCIFLAGVGFSILNQFWMVRLPYCMEVAMNAFIFYYMGYILHRKTDVKKWWTYKSRMIFLISGVLTATANYLFMHYVMHQSGITDMLKLNFGVPVLFAVSAGCIVNGLMIIFRKLFSKKGIRILEEAGRNSLLIMITHLYIYNLINILLEKIHLYYWYISLPLTLIISFIVSWLIMRYLPVLVRFSVPKNKDKSV